jgi:uncharacterized secreted protein with C-terminal beta-propeller domain
MVQKEVKNKTKLYTLVAVLSAILLVSAIYTVTTPNVMYGLLGMSPMKTFTSSEQLRNYIVTNTQKPPVFIPNTGIGATGSNDISVDDSSTYPDGYYIPSSTPSPAPRPTSTSPSGAFSDSGAASASVGAAQPSSASRGNAEYWTRPTSEGATPSFSSTNIQVVGVDEADTVKTDGKYIYTLDSKGNVQIVNTDPKNPAVIGKITFDQSISINGMYLSENGNKLAILGSNNIFGIMPLEFTRPLDDVSETTESITPRIGRTYNPQTFIYVYDVSNKANPVLTRSVTLSGNYLNSRMIGNYIYLIASQIAYADDVAVLLPQISTGEITTTIDSTSIYYTDIQDTSFSYTLFNSVNIMDDSEQSTSMTILMGASSCMYSSVNNMYVTFNTHESTELYRIAFNGANLNFKAQGTVPGYVLNQYSMDEYNNYFRIATTVSTGSWSTREEYNNLYVLNMNLDTVGKIENLAQGERIYSARFAGDKAYLVTFKQIDPFFVIDLKNPTSPKVTGELKIPGFSNYLHPYNENYMIGLGQEDNAVKVSLFDVTDMNNPTEIAKYLIGENFGYASSIAMFEPKAFLFDQQRHLLVIPVSITNNGYWQPIVPEQNSNDEVTTSTAGSWQGRSFWSGVYVFQVFTESGFTLQSELLHKLPESPDFWYAPVNRSLYIDNILYTISNGMVQLNSLDDFHLIAQVIF